MNYFDEVVIATDDRFADVALSLRGILEAFRLRVRYVHLVQLRQCHEFFGGRMMPLSGYTVLASHGFAGDEGEPGLRFEVRDHPSGDYESVTGWGFLNFDLTPTTVPNVVAGLGGTVLSLACGGGREPLADAFLNAGVETYIGGSEMGVDMDAALLFTVGFFYFLLAEARDFAPRAYTIEEAVDRASALDSGWKIGSEQFRCFTRSTC